MTSLARLVASFTPALAFDPPASWFQGRTIYGGLSVALALEAALRDAPEDLPPLKSAQISFIGPASASLRFRTEILRKGKSATMICVDCISADEVAMRVTFLFASPRASSIAHDFSRFPSVGAPDRYQPLGEVSQAPAAVQNFDLRFAGESVPVMGSSAHPELIAWVRHLDDDGVDPAVALLALADSLPPAAMASFTTFAPISSMIWTLDLPQPAVDGDWFLLRSSSQRARNGYSFQTMEVWNEAKELVLSGTQTVAIFT